MIEQEPYNHDWKEFKDGRYTYQLGQEDNYWWLVFNRNRGEELKKTLDRNRYPWYF